MRRLMLSLLVVGLALPAYGQLPDPNGLWEFNGPDATAATIGTPLELVGTTEAATGVTDDDGAVTIGEGSYYVCTHGIAPNGEGAMVNEYTLLIDFSYPTSSLSDPPNGYNDLFQTDPNNVDDSDCTINSSGAVGITDTGYTSDAGFTTQGETWYRMVIVVDNGVRHDFYFDGVEILKGNDQGIDGRYALAETLLLFCAGYEQDGDDAPINVSTVAIWNRPLESNEVLTLGAAGESVQKTNVAPSVAAGPNLTVEMDPNGVAVANIDATVVDEDPNVAITWEVISGPNDVTFGPGLDPNATDDATAAFTTTGQYVLQVSANDGEFVMSDQLAVNVWANAYGGLIAWWDFEEEWNGQTVNDISGNENHGVITDGVDGTSEYVEGYNGQGLNLLSDDFTETGDWVSLPLILPDSGSIQMWDKPINFYNYHSVLDNSGNGNDWEMWIYGDGRARFRVESDTAVTANLNNLAIDGDGQDEWWHFTCTWARDVNDPGSVATQLYVNAVLAEENTGTWVDPGDTFFLGGGHPDNDFCNATFDDVKIFDRVLAPQEVAQEVYPENAPPTVEAGDDQLVWLEPDGTGSIVLTGSVEDLDGSPVGEVTQLWEKIDGPDAIVFETPTAAETVVTITSPGIYMFQLTATDGQHIVKDVVLVDVWPNGHDGTLVHLPLDGSVQDTASGFPVFINNGPDGDNQYVDGVDGQALELIGTDGQTNNDYVAIDYVLGGRGAVAMWFRPTSLYNYNSVLDNSVEANDWEIWVYGTGELAGRIQTGYVRGVYLEAGTWYHIAMTWYRRTATPDIVDQYLYLNGQEVATNESEWVDPGTTVFLGGGNDGNDDCNGTFDEVRIYDRCPTAEEIAELATLGQ